MAEDPFGRRVGGALCLDFVNTVGGRIDVDEPGARSAAPQPYAIREERIASYDVLRLWGQLAGVLTPAEASALRRAASARPRAAAAVLARALELREALYRLFTAAIHARKPSAADVETFNRELRFARAHEVLSPASPYQWHWDGRDALDRVLWPIVRSAADLLTSADVQRVGQCPGESCGWLFLDTSRARRRTWCDMAQCGNLAKVRRFRERRRGRAKRTRAPQAAGRGPAAVVRARQPHRG